MDAPDSPAVDCAVACRRAAKALLDFRDAWDQAITQEIRRRRGREVEFMAAVDAIERPDRRLATRRAKRRAA